MNLSEQTYHTAPMSTQFMGATQYKQFLSCPAAALAACRGEYKREETTALLVGSYVDAHFAGTLDLFRAQHLEIFNSRTGELKADYLKADEIIRRIERDPVMMQYLAGDRQQILTGFIAGVPFKVKPDFLHRERIVDLKIMKDFDSVWIEGEGRRHWIEAWGYDIQGAIYQEIISQTYGERLPFFIAAATKEKVPDIDLLEIPQSRLDEMLAEVEYYAPVFSEMKLGLREAERCKKCDWCKNSRVLTGPRDYRGAVAG
jgi:hypothetical protein